MTYRTVLEVEQGLRGKVWRVKQCDDDHSAVGEIVSCGVPVKASDCRLGSTFETLLTVKE